MDVDERNAVLSVFCMPGECAVVGSEVTVTIKVEGDNEDQKSSKSDTSLHHNAAEVSLVIDIGSTYPNTVPEVSLLSVDVDRDLLSKIKDSALTYCKSLIGQPMIISLVSYIQEELQSHRSDILKSRMNSDRSDTADNTDHFTALLHIDHMRSKSKYIKTLEKWAAELCLGGRLLFYKKLILVLLQGCQGNIKDYIVRLRSSNVDVDSRGHPCKEKMMSIVCETSTPEPFKSYTDFSVCVVEDGQGLEDVFLKAGLCNIYVAYMKSSKTFS